MMTTTNRTLLVVALLLLPALTPAVGAAAQTQPAELAIEQPHYVSDDVRTSTTNGTTVYHIAAAPVDIAPQNFDAENVVDYGVLTDGGDAQLTYNEDLGTFEFSANAAGTYTLYWSAERSVAVQNETGNGTHIETRGQRYEAKLRLTDATEMVHQPASALAATRADAQRWQEWNGTVQDVQERIGGSILVDLGLAEPPTTEETLQTMVTSTLTVHTPFGMVSGNFGQILTLIVFSLGGWLFVVVVILPLLGVLAALAYRNNRFETNEADEGRLSKRFGRQQRKEDKQKLANASHNDIFTDDYLAAAMRKLGDDPLTALTRLTEIFRPRNAIHTRLQAMAQNGWVAVVDERDASGEVATAHVVPEDDAPEAAETLSLDVDANDSLIDAIDWDQSELWEAFDITEADIDLNEINTAPIDGYDLDEATRLLNLDMRQFDGREHAGQNLKELLEFFREHPVTDEHGTPDTLRYGLEHLLRAGHLYEDRYEMPVDGWIDLMEGALEAHDAGAEAEQAITDVQEGRYA